MGFSTHWRRSGGATGVAVAELFHAGGKIFDGAERLDLRESRVHDAVGFSKCRIATSIYGATACQRFGVFRQRVLCRITGDERRTLDRCNAVRTNVAIFRDDAADQWDESFVQ